MRNATKFKPAERQKVMYRDKLTMAVYFKVAARIYKKINKSMQTYANECKYAH